MTESVIFIIVKQKVFFVFISCPLILSFICCASIKLARHLILHDHLWPIVKGDINSHNLKNNVIAENPSPVKLKCDEYVPTILQTN